jgi:hypothetical protein
MTSSSTVSTLPPSIDEYWAGQGGIYGGLVVGEEGSPDGHLILAEDKPDDILNWSASIAWTKKVHKDGHSDFRLPTRRESALLYANLRGRFEAGWHWIGEQSSSTHAWYQFFDNGYQDSVSKKFEARARAVRLVQITPSVQLQAEPDEITAVLRLILAELQGVRADVREMFLSDTAAVPA